eukprot:678006-Pelagomonas_calceolata.AAC.4
MTQLAQQLPQHLHASEPIAVAPKQHHNSPCSRLSHSFCEQPPCTPPPTFSWIFCHVVGRRFVSTSSEGPPAPSPSGITATGPVYIRVADLMWSPVLQRKWAHASALSI